MYTYLNKNQNTPEKGTGLPTAVKNRLETASGLSFDDVRIHYNSEKPAVMQAYAYTQGANVYIAPGQERYLSHELGHVIQQKQGTVVSTKTLNGVPINDDPALEKAADAMDLNHV